MSVAFEDGRLADIRVFRTAADALAEWPGLAVLAMDIPIGLPDEAIPYPRKADLEARRFLRGAASTVFLMPPKEVLAEPTYTEALARCKQLLGLGISKQTYGLGPRIFEVADLREIDDRIHEIHPEASFRAMSGGIPLGRKRTRTGFEERQQLLKQNAIRIPQAALDVRRAKPDDVLDAAAAAWSATRIAAGVAESVPSPPQVGAEGRPVAIWY